MVVFPKWNLFITSVWGAWCPPQCGTLCAVLCLDTLVSGRRPCWSLITVIRWRRPRRRPEIEVKTGSRRPLLPLNRAESRAHLLSIRLATWSSFLTNRINGVLGHGVCPSQIRAWPRSAVSLERKARTVLRCTFRRRMGSPAVVSHVCEAHDVAPPIQEPFLHWGQWVNGPNSQDVFFEGASRCRRHQPL